MRLYEHEVKRLLAKHGLQVPSSGLAHDPEEVVELASRIGGPVALKAQTLIKARGKAGLIAFADTPAAAGGQAALLFSQRHHGERVAELLVEQRLQRFSEHYLGLTVDYAAGCPVVLASPLGGVEIESVARHQPDKLLRLHVSPLDGLREDQATQAALFLTGASEGENPQVCATLCANAMALYELFVERDLQMLEVNPLVVTEEQAVIALDGAAAVDDDALYRQEDLVRPRNQSYEEFARARELTARGWSYLKLDGNIGILSSGAGITMAIMDLLHQQGGRTANFLDTAQMDREGIRDAFELFFAHERSLAAVLVNIFAGLNRCDQLAEGIRDFLSGSRPPFAIVVRMVGNREEEGRRILREIGIEPVRGLEDAVTAVIELTEHRT